MGNRPKLKLTTSSVTEDVEQWELVGIQNDMYVTTLKNIVKIS